MPSTTVGNRSAMNLERISRQRDTKPTCPPPAFTISLCRLDCEQTHRQTCSSQYPVTLYKVRLPTTNLQLVDSTGSESCSTITFHNEVNNSETTAHSHILVFGFRVRQKMQIFNLNIFLFPSNTCQLWQLICCCCQ